MGLGVVCIPSDTDTVFLRSTARFTVRYAAVFQKLTSALFIDESVFLSVLQSGYFLLIYLSTRSRKLSFAILDIPVVTSNKF